MESKSKAFAKTKALAKRTTKPTLNMGNQYSEQYYIDKINVKKTEIEDTNDSLKQHRKAIKAQFKLDLLTTAMDAIIQKTNQTEQLTETLWHFKDFFESNQHIFQLEEYDEIIIPMIKVKMIQNQNST